MGATMGNTARTRQPMSGTDQNATTDTVRESSNDLPLQRRTYLRSLSAGAVVSGSAAGATATTEQDEANDDADSAQTGSCDGGVGFGCVPYGWGRYGGGPPALPGFDTPPRDGDGDGNFEDLDGDGQFDIFDVQTLYAHRNNQERTDASGNPVRVIDDYYDVYDYQATGSQEVNILNVQGIFELLKNS